VPSVAYLGHTISAAGVTLVAEREGWLAD
jgi:hypothetical protein